MFGDEVVKVEKEIKIENGGLLRWLEEGKKKMGGWLLRPELSIRMIVISC